MSEPVRKLAAVMFTDIVGSTAMMQKNEALARRALKRHKKIIEETHAEFGGKVVQYFGDGSLSIFDSAAAAVKCGIAIQKETNKNPSIPLRIGINSGDITIDDTGIYGDGVNIAARVEKTCIPNAIFITEKVYDDIKNQIDIETKDLGGYDFKNVTSTVNLYAVVDPSLSVPTDQEIRISSAPAIEKSGSRKKGIAFTLALILGVFGVHRLYLRQRGTGIAMFVLGIISIIATIDEGFPLVAIMALIGLVDAVLLLSMSTVEFDQKYNGLAKSSKVQQKQSPKAANKIFKMGIREYKRQRYEIALDLFDRSLDLHMENARAHFLTACAYSQLKQTENSISHLEAAVNLDKRYFEIARQEPDLQYIRSQKSYQYFIQRMGPVRKEIVEPPKIESPEMEASQSDTLELKPLKEIERLQKRLQDGELTKKEFDILREKIKTRR